jgi:RNA polymerase sigma-70 factor (ECF subfamily)
VQVVAAERSRVEFVQSDGIDPRDGRRRAVRRRRVRRIVSVPPVRPPDFEAVVREHGPMIARLAASYELDRGRREELRQEILLALWRALPAYRGEASLRTFVARIAHNRAATHVAREVSQPRGAALDPEWPADGADPHEAVERADRAAALLAAVAALPLGLRQPVLLTLEGFTPREIAEVLGTSPNAVSIRLTRAREALRERMEGTT